MSDEHNKSDLIWTKFVELVRQVDVSAAPALEAKLKEFLQSGKFVVDLEFRLRLTEFALGILGLLGGGGPIVTVQRHLAETVRVSNRIVSFVLDDKLHFGTGMLVGPCYVLTAAHLFFGRDGALIDRRRLEGITVEAHTTHLGQFIAEGNPRTSKLYEPHTDNWLIEPRIKNDVAQRDVDYLDFVIVRIKENFGDDSVGTAEKRRWFEIPTAQSAEILASEVAVQVFQYLDREALLTASGFVRDVTQDGYRVLHTASTADSASGAALLDDDFQLVAMHLSGSASGEWPRSNRGLPIRRVAEVIDQSMANGSTVRELLGSCPK